MAQWLTQSDAERVALHWQDAPLDPETLGPLLAAAADQCQAYASPATIAAMVLMPDLPHRLALAQIFQARALYRAATAGGGDTIGIDGLTVTVYPMDRTVKALIRPKTGTPVIA